MLAQFVKEKGSGRWGTT